jgi:hypothetical protein
MADVSHELLAHFDGPQKRQAPLRLPTRGVFWVVRWPATVVSLLLTALQLTQFAYCLSAERSLTRAARAGVLEATLPRATQRSVTNTIMSQLTGTLVDRVQLSVQRNGTPVVGNLRTSDGDRFEVALAVPASDAMPHWLRAVSFWTADSPITVRAERQSPGRKLRQL